MIVTLPGRVYRPGSFFSTGINHPTPRSKELPPMKEIITVLMVVASAVVLSVVEIPLPPPDSRKP